MFTQLCVLPPITVVAGIAPEIDESDAAANDRACSRIVDRRCQPLMK